MMGRRERAQRDGAASAGEMEALRELELRRETVTRGVGGFGAGGRAANVVPASPAHAAGLLVGDVIKGAGGRLVNSEQALKDAAASLDGVEKPALVVVPCSRAVKK